MPRRHPPRRRPAGPAPARPAAMGGSSLWAATLRVFSWRSRFPVGTQACSHPAGQFPGEVLARAQASALGREPPLETDRQGEVLARAQRLELGFTEGIAF